MSLYVSHTVFQKYLDVVIKGERTLGDELHEMIAIWQEIFDLSRRYGLNYIMSRDKTKGRFPLNAQINFALRMEEMGCTKDHRIACLAYSNQSFDDQQLIVKYVRAQGFHSQLFNKEVEALEWLLQSPASDKTKSELSFK